MRRILLGGVYGAGAALGWQLVLTLLFPPAVRDAQGSIVFILMAAAIYFAPFTAVCGALIGWMTNFEQTRRVLAGAVVAAAIAMGATLWRFGSTGEMVVIAPFGEHFWRTVGHRSSGTAMLFAAERTVPYHAAAVAVFGAVIVVITHRLRGRRRT